MHLYMHALGAHHREGVPRGFQDTLYDRPGELTIVTIQDWGFIDKAAALM